MGSNMKNTIVEEWIYSGLRIWHKRAKINRKKKLESGFSSRLGARELECGNNSKPWIFSIVERLHRNISLQNK